MNADLFVAIRYVLTPADALQALDAALLAVWVEGMRMSTLELSDIAALIAEEGAPGCAVQGGRDQMFPAIKTK